MDERRKIGVVVDAGHGGDDPGALGNNLKEKDLTLQAARYMYDRLQELGVPTVITRDSDESLGRNERVNRILSAFGNDPEVIVVSNHINAGGGEGAEVVYSLRNNSTLATSVLNEIGNKGQLKRKVYQRRLPEDPSKDYYYIMRLTGRTEPILVEYGFIDNQRDANKLKSNLTNYVEGAVKAITEYAGYTYTPPLDGNNDITEGEYYIVNRGDTLYSISRKFNVSVDELRRLNNLNNNILQIGQRLLIKPDNSINDDISTSTYIVKPGDTLYSIARVYNISVDKLKELNNLDSNILTVGQELIIRENTLVPNLPSDSNSSTYIVKRGDSLYSIANMYKTTVQNLINLNNLTSNVLQIGQELVVPNNTNIETDISDSNTNVDTGTNIDSNVTMYTVEKNDTLYSIARRFNTTVDEIVRLNNLTSDLISPNAVLMIPVTESRNNSDFYIIKRGDTLWSIAKKNNITVNDLMTYNNLKSINLSIGDKLQIPNTNRIYYTVKEGDTIFSIAAANNLSVEELKNLNNLTSNAVTLGEELIIG